MPPEPKQTHRTTDELDNLPTNPDTFLPGLCLANQMYHAVVSQHYPEMREEPNLPVLQTTIGEIFEGYLKSRVRRVADKHDVNKICLSSAGVFDSQTRLELADRLGLDPDFEDLLDPLFAQVCIYVQQVKPRRAWGYMEVVDSDLFLQLRRTS